MWFNHLTALILTYQIEYNYDFILIFYDIEQGFTPSIDSPSFLSVEIGVCMTILSIRLICNEIRVVIYERNAALVSHE